MGQITITPSYVTLSHGAAWSSLGGNEAAAKTVVQQVCDDLKSGLRTNGADIGCVVQCGLNAYPLNPSDTAGQAVGAGGSNTFAGAALGDTWTVFRNFLLGISSPNTLQQSAWNTTNLPVTAPTVDGTQWGFIDYSMALLGMWDPSNVNFTNNTIVGGAGVNSGAYPDLDQYGTGAGTNFYEGWFHEITECIFTRYASASTSSVMYPWDVFEYSAAGTRTVLSSSTRYLSQDGGTTNIASMNTGAGDPGDFAALSGDAFNASVTSGPVSRSSSVPGQQRDWQALALYLPMSANGNTWGGMSTGTGVGSSTGIATVTGIGAAQANAVASSTGQGLVTGVGMGTQTLSVPGIGMPLRFIGH